MWSRLLIAFIALGLLGVASQPALAASTNVNIQGGYYSYLPLVMSYSEPRGLINGDFESGRGVAWEEFSTHGWELVINSGYPGDLIPHSGSWLAWLGGDFDDTSRLTQSGIFMAGTGSLHYWYWIGSMDDTCGHDFAYVKVNDLALTTHQLCIPSNTVGWAEGIIDLNSYADTIITLQFEVVTDQTLNSNFFLDDVSIVP